MDAYGFAEREGVAGGPLLFLFHGTGGDENQFLAIAPQLLAGARLIAPLGDVSEHGATRYFRRTGEGLYDMADLARATDKVAEFIRTQVAAHPHSLVAALGYSNGANILASVLFKAPELIERAVLMHPLIPFAPAAQPGLRGHKVLITAGRHDPICPVPLTEKLDAYLTAQGAETRGFWHEGGHELRQAEFAEAHVFLSA